MTPQASAIVMYFAALAGAELLFVFFGAVSASVAHALLAVTLLTHAGMGDQRLRRPTVALAVLPLVRLLGLLLPIPGLPPLAWFVLIGIGTLLAVTAAARVLALDSRALGLTAPLSPAQAGIALIGLPGGLLAYLVAPSAPFGRELTVPVLALALETLAVFVAAGEELAMRGILQTVIREEFGSLAAIVASTAATVILLLATSSVAQVGVFALLGVALAVGMERTRSIVGAIGARTLIAFGLLFLWPAVLP